MTHPKKSAPPGTPQRSEEGGARDFLGTPGRALLRLYPREWRERYGDEFALVLRATPPGPGAVLDVVRGALDAHVRAARPRPLVCGALLAVCAAVVGWMNLHTTDDVQPVAAALLVCGFGFGVQRPARAWRYALVLFAAVPLSSLWAELTAKHHLDVLILETVIAVIPGLFGAYIGALVGWGFRRARA
jgi:hypothetical protein